MVYLFIGKNRIKLVAFSKTLFGQYSVSFFDKIHAATLLDNGTVANTDVLASAVKEAFTSSTPQEVKQNDIYLILPQEAFTFARYEIPSDIQTSAIEPFIRDKARADFEFDLDNTHSDFLIVKQDTESTVLLYMLKAEVCAKYEEALKLLGLNIKAIVPETVAYYKLFEKTLKKDKKENILYASYQEDGSWGYLYDSLGLLGEKGLSFSSKIETELKELATKNEKKGTKIDRVILSGEKSAGVRQDLFTKEVGIWTNPLDKIIPNFYQDYLKLLVPQKGEVFPTLTYDVCLGSFILHRENPEFSVYKGNIGFGPSKGKAMPSISLSMPAIPIRGRDVVIFLVSMIITSLLIYGAGKFGLTGNKLSLPSISQKTTPTPAGQSPLGGANPKSPTPTPTPSFDRETIKIKVLNGTGTVGQAGQMVDLLKEKGYVEVLTGNAENYDYQETQIQVIKAKQGAAQMVRQDIGDGVEIADKDISTLDDEEETADIIIITGADFEP